MVTTCFGLHGGIGNSLFCLPAIQALSEYGPVYLYVHGDYQMTELWRRCRYATRVYGVGDPIPQADQYLCGQYAPPEWSGKVPYWKCGWPKGEHEYRRPEWQQVLDLSGCGTGRRDVSDWIAPTSPEKNWHVGIVPGCKPGAEWQRKKYPGMQDVARGLIDRGKRVAVFGQRIDCDDPFVGDDLRDGVSLVDMPDVLRRCHVIVGTDSGMMHLASSLGIPVVAIYTATSPVKGDPVGRPAVKLHRSLACSPCQSTQRWGACDDWLCRGVPVDEVIQSALRFLGEIA